MSWGDFVLACFVCSSAFLTADARPEWRNLEAGVEKFGERLALASQGSAVYTVHGLDPSLTYEIKISSPSSIPATFDLTLLQPRSSNSRRLLNVEKLIFPAKEHLLDGTVQVLVEVKPAGVLTSQKLKEQEFIVYNILCERVYLGGIPEQAWWIGFLALVAIGFSFFVARRLPHWLPQHES